MAIPSQLVLRTKQLQIQASQHAVRAVQRVLPDLAKLDRQEAGGVVRQLATGSIQEFGNVATQAARLSYDEMRSAAKPTASKYVAQAIDLAVGDRADVIIGATMAQVSRGKAAEGAALFLDSLDKVVSDVFRQTIVSNSDFDGAATGYQRVASASACAFCSMVALNEYTTFDDGGGYHNSCGCTTVPIFRGQSSYRPDYYDQFESDYADAWELRRSADFQEPALDPATYGPGKASERNSKTLISAIRQVSGRS